MMKRISMLFLAICLIACFLLPVSAFAIAEEDAQLLHITDMTGLLTEEQKNELETAAAAVSSQYQCSVYAVIVDDFSKYASSNDVTLPQR